MHFTQKDKVRLGLQKAGSPGFQNKCEQCQPDIIYGDQGYKVERARHCIVSKLKFTKAMFKLFSKLCNILYSCEPHNWKQIFAAA